MNKLIPKLFLDIPGTNSLYASYFDLNLNKIKIFILLLEILSKSERNVIH